MAAIGEPWSGFPERHRGRLLINKWQGVGVPCRDYQGPVQRSKPIVAPSALSPSSSAPSARRYAASELDRSARSSKPLTAPLKHSQDARRKIENTFSRTSLIGGVLVFTAYALWIYSRNAADSCSITHSRCLTMSPIDTMPTS